MVDVKRRGAHNLVNIPPEHVSYVEKVLEVKGARRAVVELGIGRAAQLTVIAKHKASPGTAALLREAFARRGGVRA